MLQRGRGAGYLWALTAPREEALAAVMACVRADPRQEPQLDEVAALYADIFEALDFDLAPIEDVLRGPGNDPDLRSANRATDIAIDILVEAVARGTRRGPDAIRILREYITTGTSWAPATDALFWSSSRSPDLSWVEAAIAVRFPDDESLRSAMDSDASFSWESFMEHGWLHHPRIVAMAATLMVARVRPPGSAQGPAADRRKLPADPSSIATRTLLTLAPEGLSKRKHLAELLARRDSPTDLDLLDHASRDPEGCDRVALAIHALALRGQSEMLEVASTHLEGDRFPRHLWSWLYWAAEDMPPGASLPWARKWYGSERPIRHRLATGILENHALPEDRERLVAVIARELDKIPGKDEPACVCGDLQALDLAGADGCRDLLERVFQETWDYGSRKRAMEMLAGTPGGVPADLAIEGLWDGCELVRELAARTVPLDAPGVRERLRVLAARDPEDEEAAVIAEVRLNAKA
jgi:hypothetical protein